VAPAPVAEAPKLRDKDRQKLQKRVADLEKKLEVSQGEQAVVETKLGDANIYAPARKGELEKALAARDELAARIAALEEQLLAALEELEAAGG
jgi:septal ring factor EnvC (AmiA/AmiB activator)